jgi:hypothetical protein
MNTSADALSLSGLLGFLPQRQVTETQSAEANRPGRDRRFSAANTPTAKLVWAGTGGLRGREGPAAPRRMGRRGQPRLLGSGLRAVDPVQHRGRSRCAQASLAIIRR